MNQKIGKKGEDLAARYLLDRGYQIIKRNYRTPYGEIDVICEYNKTLVFVEVKTRTSRKFGSPQEAVTHRKIDHLKKAALLFLDERDKPFGQLRFDVISILLQDGKVEIEHIESAF